MLFECDRAKEKSLNAYYACFERVFESLGMTNSDVVMGIHRNWVLAGFDVIEKNTRGSKHLKMFKVRFRLQVISRGYYSWCCCGLLGQPEKPRVGFLAGNLVDTL